MAATLIVCVVAFAGPAPATERATGCRRTHYVGRYGTWTLTPLPEPPARYTKEIDALAFRRELSFYATDPLDPNILYVADDWMVMRSTDRGCHWSVAFDLLDSPDAAPNDHFVSLDAVALPDGTTRVAALTRRDPYGDERVTEGTSAFVTGDGGDEWSFTPITGAGGAPIPGVAERVFVAPRHPSALYLAVQNPSFLSAELYASDDAGATWELRTTSLLASIDPAMLAVDPSDPLHLYAAGADGIYSSKDGGASWDELQPVTTEETGDLQGIDVYWQDHAAPRIIALGRYKWLISRDGGKSWSLEEPSATKARGNPVEHIADSWADGRNGEIVFTTTKGQTFAHIGSKWLDVSLSGWGCASVNEDYHRDHLYR